MTQQQPFAQSAICNLQSAINDPRLPHLPAALDAAQLMPRLAQALAQRDMRLVELHAMRLTRHKPGRRCLLEYDVTLARGGCRESLTVIGKMRAKGADRATHDLHLALRAAGFCERSRAGVAVPEPLGLLPELGMWLQRKVPGLPATELLASSTGAALARRIAAAVHAFHGAAVSPRRSHSLADELRILHERLGALAELQPAWRERLTRMLRGCEALASSLPASQPQGIHRDFYPDQLIVNDERLYFIDLDLFATGDPALDIGNFLGHMREYAMRELGDGQALLDQEEAFARAYCLRSGLSYMTVAAYALLTLARHIAISSQFPNRRHLTPVLLAYCETALGLE
ncbi:MAG: phosphotransferase [Chloroflexaceae bacterium]|jgi:hypothetical protein|nr:phosphotransferase [Chloroflexaceae bacterium]